VGRNYVATENLLLGLVRDEDHVAFVSQADGDRFYSGFATRWAKESRPGSRPGAEIGS